MNEAARTAQLEAALRDAVWVTRRLLELVRPDDVSDVRGPEGQLEGDYRLAAIEGRVAEWEALAQGLAA